MVSTGPSSASGGSTTFTREPSGRRASHSGSDSSARRPSGARMRSITCAQLGLAREPHVGLREPAAALDPHRRGPADEDLVDAGVAQQRLERPEADRALGDPRRERRAGARVEHARPRARRWRRCGRRGSSPPAASPAPSTSRSRSAPARSSSGSMPSGRRARRDLAPGRSARRRSGLGDRRGLAVGAPAAPGRDLLGAGGRRGPRTGTRARALPSASSTVPIASGAGMRASEPPSARRVEPPDLDHDRRPAVRRPHEPRPPRRPAGQRVEPVAAARSRSRGRTSRRARAAGR